MDPLLTDRLIEQIRSDQAGAFDELVKQTYRFAYARVYRMTRSPEDSKDIVQEAYIRVWKNIGKYDPGRSFSSWFSRILRNLVIDWLRNRSSRPIRAVAVSETAKEAPGGIQPDRVLENREIRQLIVEWLPGLPDRQQQVFIMRDLEDLSIREVRAETGLSEQNIKTCLCMARKKLRKYLLSRGYR